MQLVEIVQEMVLLQRWLAAGAEAVGGGADAAGGAEAASGAEVTGGVEAAGGGAAPPEGAVRRRRVCFSTHDASHLLMVDHAAPNPSS